MVIVAELPRLAFVRFVLVAIASCRQPPMENAVTIAKSAPPADSTAPPASAPPAPSTSAIASAPAPASGGRLGCVKDDDCVPAVCCHANRCVPKARKPECRGIMCTMMCVPGTIDCGGSCRCQTGKCVAVGPS